VTEAEQREKNRITLVSVAAALVLTTLKLVVGLLTGSLGLISEAAHSGLDLVASILTFFSVRIAGRPADANHPYGHERMENLSALIQGVMLLGTASWILYESVRRIAFATVEVETSPWTFAVMGGSILIDLWRSTLLSRAARKYHSRALEADALNFRADMFSASVVILGLALTAYAELTRRDGFLVKADAVAALVVGLVIIAMSGRLALQAVGVLLDRAPEDVRGRMTRAVASVPGVLASEPVRLRESGSRLFADVVVGVARTTSLAAAHTIAEQVEAAIRAVEPRTETVVHVEPVVSDTESAADRVRAVALQLGAHTHHEQVSRVGDHLEASVHLEVAPDLTLGEAHDRAHDLVTAIKRSDSWVERVDTHIEVAEPDPDPRRDITREHRDVVDALARTVRDVDGEAQTREMYLFRSDEPGLDLVLHCGFPRGAHMGEIHRRTERIEQALRERYPDLRRIVIHAEPDDNPLPHAEVHRRGHTVGSGR
jgi:cation diffusion facilitator family transporter